MIYLDANVLIAAAANVAEASEQAERLLRGKGEFYTSRLADYEARKYLCRLESGDPQENLTLLLAGKVTLGKEWDGAVLQALKISRQFKQRLWVDSADTLHVGWALSVGAEVFASFDRESGPRALALVMGLKLWPEAGPRDYELRKRFKV